MTNDDPREKTLETASFVVHATRGIVRAQKMRRQVMLVLLVAAVVLLVLGFTLLQSALSPREHPVSFLLFWAVCGWLTFTAMLLAIYDLLLVRVQLRRAQRELREELARAAETSTTDPT